jgi:hypothetical protein
VNDSARFVETANRTRATSLFAKKNGRQELGTEIKVAQLS